MILTNLLYKKKHLKPGELPNKEEKLVCFFKINVG